MKFKLIEKRQEAKGTKSFFWLPEKDIKYYPGQYFYLTLEKLIYPDPKGATRHFTASSSPTEGNVIRITTRIREESGFKKSLDNLEIGSLVEAEGPEGDFIFDPKNNDNIFLAGGIGITPFRSMINYVKDKNLSNNIILIHSNSTPEEIAFASEFDLIAKSTPTIKIYTTVSKPEESVRKWTGLIGRIDQTLLEKLVSGDKIQSATFWVCGPPTMVDAMQVILGNLQINLSHIKTEKFTGY